MTKRIVDKQCPFCGGVFSGEDGDLGLVSDHQGGPHWVACFGCGATGPSADTRREARARWNERLRNEQIQPPASESAARKDGGR
jgi:hypothetical protein